MLLAILVSLVGALTGSEGTSDWSAYFSLHPHITGKTCTVNRTFTLEGVPSLATCAFRCKQDADCGSFFYSSGTTRCDGCRPLYTDGSSLTEVMTDSVHYRRCPAGWGSYGHSCYLFDPAVSWRSFAQSKSHCESLSSYLVRIETHEELLYLMKYLDSTYKPEYGYVHYWMGLSNGAPLNVWNWEDTQDPATFTNWGTSQPPAGGPYCGWMSHSHNYTWNAEGCSQNWNLYPLCEV